MDGIWLLLVWNVVLASCLAMSIAIAGSLQSMRDRPALRHALWLLVLLKLVTPPLIPLPLLTDSYGEFETAAKATVVATMEKALDLSPAAHDDGAFSQKSRYDWARDLGHGGAIPFLCGILGTVTVLVLVRVACEMLEVSRLLRRAKWDDRRLKSIVRKAAQNMRVNVLPQACLVTARVAPMLWVRRRCPVIVLSKTLVEQLDDEQLMCIACHELAHYIRRDHWSNAFAMFVGALFWWHPVVSWARREMRVAQEVCCDAIVIGDSSARRRLYAETLLLVVEYVQYKRPLLPGLASGFGGESSMKRRFEMIAAQNVKHRVSWCGCVFMLCAIVAACCFPVYAQTQPAAEEQEPVAAPGIERKAGLRSEATQSVNPMAVKRALRSVVNIHGHKKIRDNTTRRRVDAMGAGVVVDERGYIMTNYHVVEGVQRIEVSMSDSQRLVGQLVAYDPPSDLAIIKIDLDKPLTVMRIATSKDLTVGEPVIAVGNAYGRGHTVEHGVISAVDRAVSIDNDWKYGGLIQTDVSVHPGSSGGPLLNRGGELIGINLAFLIGGKGIGFAVPSDQAIAVASGLIKKTTK